MKEKRGHFERKISRYIKRFTKNFHLTARKMVLAIIVATAVIVAISLLLYMFLNPEARTKRQIESMARDYYETYYYENFKNTTDSLAGFEAYAEKGFSKTTLRQLLLFDGGRYKKLTDSLIEYCDENTTTVQFFPEEPYMAKNYRIEFNYSCNF